MTLNLNQLQMAKMTTKSGTTRIVASPTHGHCTIAYSLLHHCTSWWRWPIGISKYIYLHWKKSSNLTSILIKWFKPSLQTEFNVGNIQHESSLNVDKNDLQLDMHRPLRLVIGCANRFVRSCIWINHQRARARKADLNQRNKNYIN